MTPLLYGGPGNGGWIRLFPESAARGAADVDAIFVALIAFSGLIAMAVGSLIIVFAIRYRASSKASRAGRVQRTTPYELGWIGAFTLVGLGLFFWAGKVYLNQARPPADAHTIYVVGKQWMWKVKHPGGREEINSLHVPAGVPVKLVLTSQDVIHSLYIPAFRTKQDALPDRYTTMWFEATVPGTYHLFCAEYCGTEHSAMRGEVVVMPPADYEAWLDASAPPPAPGQPGTPEAPLLVAGTGPFFRYGCTSCHLPTSAVRAPRLDGLYGSEVRLVDGSAVIADEQYIRESILEPQEKITAGYPQPSLMPTYRGQVTEDDLQELVEFIRGLRNGWPEEVQP